MNAIAYHPAEGFRDPFGGKEDISRSLIRGVGEPAKRFQEDALRMLRCVRFAAQLGFQMCIRDSHLSLHRASIQMLYTTKYHVSPLFYAK